MSAAKDANVEGVIADKLEKANTPDEPANVKTFIPQEVVKNREEFSNIIKDSCISCHSIGGLAGTFDFSSLKNPSDWGNSPYVVPGKPLESSLYYRLRDSKGDTSKGKKDMPTVQALPKEEIETIEQFINDLEAYGGELNLAFSFEETERQTLPYRIRLSKLAQVLEQPSISAMQGQENLRISLGDYKYSEGISEKTVWTFFEISRWLEAVNGACQQSPTIRNLKWPEGMQSFALKSLGRQLSASELVEYNKIDRMTDSDAEKAILFCTTILSTVEFMTQKSDGNDGLTRYLNHIAAILVHRIPTKSEYTAVNEKGIEGLRQVLEAYTKNENFYDSVKIMIDQLLRTSGKSRDVDYDLPGYLARFLAKSSAPISTLLTASRCIDGRGGEVDCNKDSPIEAGVLGTKAFLVSSAGPFNISRAGSLMRKFACLEYPLPTELETRAPKESLIPTFATTAGNGFGNGNNCYSCHSQFAKGTQLFVKFNHLGQYIEEANGLQKESADVLGGISERNTYVSHFKGSNQAGNEASIFFNQPVSNLQDAAKILSESDEFNKCMTKNSLSHFLSLKDTSTSTIKDALLDQIVKRATSKGGSLNFSSLIVEALSHENVIESFLNQ